MIRSQGRYFSTDEVNRILKLLRDSDLTLPQIADRMQCSRSAVASINRKFQIRVYAGKRAEWMLKQAGSETAEEALPALTFSVSKTSGSC
jgi:predicted DNA-binding protein YlxM (UPF0122 family)